MSAAGASSDACVGNARHVASPACACSFTEAGASPFERMSQKTNALSSPTDARVQGSRGAYLRRGPNSQRDEDRFR